MFPFKFYMNCESCNTPLQNPQSDCPNCINRRNAPRRSRRIDINNPPINAQLNNRQNYNRLRMMYYAENNLIENFSLDVIPSEMEFIRFVEDFIFKQFEEGRTADEIRTYSYGLAFDTIFNRINFYFSRYSDVKYFIVDFPRVKNLYDHTCTYCMLDISIDDECFLFDCQHAFHCDCIINWLKYYGTCPNCRQVVCKKPKSNMDD